MDVDVELGVYVGLCGGVAASDRHHPGNVLKIMGRRYPNLSRADKVKVIRRQTIGRRRVLLESTPAS